jgi:hypothetical protein
LQQNSPDRLEALVRTLGGRSLEKRDFMELLQAAIDKGSGRCAELLCDLSAAGYMSVAELQQLVRAAEEGGDCACIQAARQAYEAWLRDYAHE